MGLFSDCNKPVIRYPLFEVKNMTALAEKIYDEVLDLPSDERLGLIDKLLESITPAAQSIQDAWVKEAEKRLQEYKAGHVETIPGEKVFSKIYGRLNR